MLTSIQWFNPTNQTQEKGATMNQTQEKKLRNVLESGDQLLTLKQVLDIVLETNLPDEIKKLVIKVRKRAWEMFSETQEQTMKPPSLTSSPKPKEKSANP